jgi:cullin 3
MLSTRKPNKFKAPVLPKSAGDSWEILKNGILQIFKKSQSNLSFEELYRNGYLLVVAKKGEEAYNNTKELIGGELRSQMSTLGSSQQHDQYLTNFKFMFDAHMVIIKMIRDILMYLDRTILKQKNLPLCFDMGIGHVLF